MDRLEREDGEWAGLCSRRFLKRGLLACLVAAGLAAAQTTQKTAAKRPEVRRANEMTLAGLRPGRDTLPRAQRLCKRFGDPHEEQGDSIWEDRCHKISLTVTYGQEQRIETIRIGKTKGSIDADCFEDIKREPWQTGRGLKVGDLAEKIAEVYGEPESKSPSTRDGQPLELWYYAFDWAGPDVPQVMEVLCTREKDGKAGRVVEITLAAPSL